MANIQTSIPSSSRFLVAGKECIYRLFDAFVKKTFVENSTIDFSKPVVVAKDGSIEFASGDLRFSDIIGSIPVKAKSASAVAESNAALGNFLSGMETEVSEEPVEAVEIVDKATKEGSKRATKPAMKVTKEVMDDMNFAAAHLNWLWSLGMESRPTSCGKYGKAVSIEENWMAGLEGYENNDGLWDVKLVGAKKDLFLLYCILSRFMTWPNKPEFKTVEEVKAALVGYVFKTRKDCVALVRNGLLHFCNPDKYINMYSYEKKAAFVKSHSDLLQGFVVSDYFAMKMQDSLYFSMKFKNDLGYGPYQANRTEEKICYIFDKMHSRVAR